MTVPSIIAAHAARQRAQEQATLDAFRVADATAPSRAQPLARLAGAAPEAVARLVNAGVVRAAGRDRYYLDEAAVVARRDTAPRVAPPPGVILIVGLLVLAALVMLGVIARG